MNDAIRTCPSRGYRMVGGIGSTKFYVLPVHLQPAANYLPIPVSDY